ncbi:MAG TPA: 2-dehydropantoate 2-reductase [Spirochaetia bacterium]|nr:2-dehydropantoate 2-reductase [Spirochaetia bacterium]
MDGSDNEAASRVEPTIAVIGAGSIGGATAAMLARSGHSVEIVCKHDRLAEKIRRQGIDLSGRLGSARVRMPAVAKVGELSGRKDIVFLATKAQDMAAPARELLPFLTDGSLVVSLQNGICIDALSEIIGRNRVVGCIVGWGSTMRDDGSIEVTSSGSYVVGRPDGVVDAPLKQIAALLSDILPTRITTNIYGALYSKLMINACINSIGALSGLPMGAMLAERRVPRIFQAILREAEGVARAARIVVEPYSGQFKLYRIITGAGPFSTALSGFFSLLVRLLGYGDVRPSTLQSIERGRTTEIDWLNGYLVELGRLHGAATPVNERIVEMVKEIEQGRRAIGTANLDDLY